MGMRLVVCWLVVMVMGGWGVVWAEDEVAGMIERAGSVEDERERYRILEMLAERGDLSEGLRGDLEIVLGIVDRWANGREKYWTDVEQSRAAENGYLCSAFTRITRDFDAYPPQISETSLLYPIWCMYRGRVLIQGPIQSGTLANSDSLRSLYYDGGRRFLKVAHEAFPENRVMGMYFGKPIPWPVKHQADENAPDWANAQREALEKLAEIIYFWIDERQAPDGQFGGGWGDDVEMWRSWATVLLGFEDGKVNAAQRKISDGLFGLSRMEGGYTSRMSDVEHTGEDSGDTGTAMMHIAPEDSIWSARARHLGVLMRDLWAGYNERGMLQFKSTYFTSQEVHADSQRACDTVYHPRAVQPALLYWQRTGDEALTKLFSAWMDTWVDATARVEHGKPAGVIPSAIHWPDGRVGGLSDAWWDPKNHGESTLYRWPSAMDMMTSTLLLTYHMTGDDRYLEPVRSMAKIRSDYLKNPVKNAPAGSVWWCASKMGFLSDTLGKYRLLTGDTVFDDLLDQDAGGYVQFRMTGDREVLGRALAQTVAAFGFDREGYTSEVRWTDRLFAFRRKYVQRYVKETLPRPNLGLLYRSVTGDFGNPLYFPMNAVRWKTTPQDFAVLVTDHSTQHVKAELYHFGDEPREMGAELFLLKPGNYKYMLSTQTEIPEDVAVGHVQVTGQRTVVNFTVPPQTLCKFQIEHKE